MQKSIKVISNKVDKSILLTLEKPYFSLIWLHGLGDTSAGFLDLFQLDSSPVFRGGRVKLLHAPIRPVTINDGVPCPSWYDIKSLSGMGQ
jgi:predicted esterase